MSSARPVLVIHGVANRSYDDFAANVKSLQDGIGSGWRLIPVYWGDIGAPVEGITETVPTPDVGREAAIAAIGLANLGVPPRQAEARALGLALLSAANQRGLIGLANVGDPVAVVLAATFARLHAMGVLDQDDAVVEALEANRDRLETLASADNSTLTAIGVTIAERYVGVTAAPDPVEPFGIIDTMKGAVDKTLDAVVGAVTHIIDGIGGIANDVLRKWVLEGLGTGIGDVLRYQGEQGLIQGRVTKCLRSEAKGWGTKDHPVAILGHSLGGIIAFDLAVRAEDPIWIDPLITFGSQSSVVEVFDPRPSVPAFRPGHRIPVPPTIGHWLNVWSSIDILAFSAQKLFRGADADVVEDVRMAFLGGTDLFTHDAYWDDPRMFAEARRALEQHTHRLEGD